MPQMSASGVSYKGRWRVEVCGHPKAPILVSSVPDHSLGEAMAAVVFYSARRSRGCFRSALAEVLNGRAGQFTRPVAFFPALGSAITHLVQGRRFVQLAIFGSGFCPSTSSHIRAGIRSVTSAAPPPNKSLQRTFDPPRTFAVAKARVASNAAELRRWASCQRFFRLELS